MKKLAPLGPVYQAGTYSGNPVSVAAGLTTLRSLKKRSSRLYTSLERNGEFLADGIKDAIDTQHVPAQINQIGSMFQIFFTRRTVTDYDSAKSSDAGIYNRYFRRLLKARVFMPPSQLETCFLCTVHTREDVEETIEAVGESLKAVQGE